MFENLQGGQFSYVINSVDSTNLPCYSPTDTAPRFPQKFTPIYSYILFIIKLFQNHFVILFFKFFFFAIGDPICDPVRDAIQSNPIRSWFCQGVHILINPQPQLFLHEGVSYNCC